MQGSIARKSAGNQVGNFPIASAVFNTEYDETVCYDDVAGGSPVRFKIVEKAVEDTTNSKATDVADGLRRGLHILGINTDNDDGAAHANDCDWTKSGQNWLIGGIDQAASPPTNVTSHCSRGAAATQIIVLLTDGAPTDDGIAPGTNGPGDNVDCKTWVPNTITTLLPGPYAEAGEPFPVDDKFECIMYYAQIARNNGIIVYTIGLGAGRDDLLLRSVADETNGDYYVAPSSAQLDIIFSQILANIYVRLVQ